MWLSTLTLFYYSNIWRFVSSLFSHPQWTPSSSTPQSRWPSQVCVQMHIVRLCGWISLVLNLSTTIWPSPPCCCWASVDLNVLSVCWCVRMFPQPLGTRRLTSGATWCSFLPPSHHQMSVWVAFSLLRVSTGISCNIMEVKRCFFFCQRVYSMYQVTEY